MYHRELQIHIQLCTCNCNCMEIHIYIYIYIYIYVYIFIYDLDDVGSAIVGCVVHNADNPATTGYLDTSHMSWHAICE